MLEVKTAKYLEGYKIELLFNNGIMKTVDLEKSLTGKVFERLKNLDYFTGFRIHFNTIEWENGADFAPEYLFEL